MGREMNLLLHRREDAPDTEIRITKVLARWSTADKIAEIPITDAEALAGALIGALPTEAVLELNRLLTAHFARA